MCLVQEVWSTYRRLVARYPVVRKVFAPLRWYYHKILVPLQWYYHYNYLSYAFHRRVRGLSYREWYARTLNSYATYFDPAAMEGFESQRGMHQLEYIKKHGLRPSHCLLDFGCGYLRAGVHFIGYLDAGKYTGADISQGRLDVGRREINKHGLGDQRPELVFLPNITLDTLSSRRFDFIWAHGVIGHMPLEDVEALLKNLHKIMGRSSVFFANYTESDKGDYQPLGLRHFFYRYEVFERLCAQSELRCELMHDWNATERTEYATKDRMLRITLKAEPHMWKTAR